MDKTPSRVVTNVFFTAMSHTLVDILVDGTCLEVRKLTNAVELNKMTAIVWEVDD